MRARRFLFALAILIVVGTPATAMPFAIESFTYGTTAPRELHGQDGGVGWAGPWSADTAKTDVVEPATPLQYQVPGGALIDGGDRALALTGANDNLAVRPLAAPQADDVYISFLLRWAGGNFNDNDFAVFWFDSRDGPNIGVKMNEGGGGTRDFMARLGPFGGAVVYGGDIQDHSTTFLVVGRLYKSVPGGNYDRYSLWVNPAYGDFANPLGTATRDVGFASFTKAGIRTFQLHDDTVLIDELRIGRQWRDVVPLPEPGTVALLGLGLLGFARRRKN